MKLSVWFDLLKVYEGARQDHVRDEAQVCYKRDPQSVRSSLFAKQSFSEKQRESNKEKRERKYGSWKRK